MNPTHAQTVNAAYDLLEALRIAGKPVLVAKTATIHAELLTGRWIDTGRPGWGDLVAVVNGRFLMIEIKTGTGRQRKAQREMQAMCEFAGGDYLICDLAALRDYLRARRVM